MASEAPDNAGVRVPPPLHYLLPLMAGLGLRTVLPGIPLPRLLRRVVGVLLVAAGGTLIVWFGRTMQRAGTPIRPTERVVALVTDGPFTLSRNPAYLGMAAIYTGLALVLNLLTSLLALPVVLWAVTHFVIEREEPYLEQRFGEAYRNYQARVRRWL
jgi:protein-S-isoprenylcysteine O-methyltransferase Ste14